MPFPSAVRTSAWLGSGRKPPKSRWNCNRLVTSLGLPESGPRAVSPTMPAVLVATPVIGRGPVEISST
jgi:hypothetical protein